jgi:GNAT superfamily N-acetyltransferase
VRTEIRLARTDGEYRAAFALRAQVFFSEGILDRDRHRDDRNDGLLVEIFDALPSSQLVVAVSGDRVVGTVRVTIQGEAPVPYEAYGITDAVLPDGAVVASGSLLCVAPGFRVHTLGLRLVRFAMAQAWSRGCTHAVAPIRPEAEVLFLRLGWFRVADPFHHPVEDVLVVPMAVENVRPGPTGPRQALRRGEKAGV